MRPIFWLSALALACGLSVQAAQVYKWTDDKGVTHFSAQPPDGQKANEVDVKVAPQINGGGSAPTYKMPNGAQQPSVSNDAQQQELDRKVKAQVREDQAKLKAQCDQARQNLAQLRNNPRILVQSGRGETRRLTEEERQQRLAETQLSIEQNCGK
ncbi:DUF4124 domain-containing protein [Pseudomonas rhizoryzae]|uniref:DUF4124 domain-containing protein n=1 Tax=Pseudomonas rhizoryzae TaxID=2571129 RepID=UPI0007372973|nr:DUF4124 domain-containing protein [Pseudomonas rhizoryzae]KTT27910.1 hypothetical protein NS201_22205 [Pseudomonas psychrotolerans]KTT36015.1 hypothetical protein SB9_07310 [Pseudomonas psychrotolerans]KTT73642.1 hypothetical protein SB18R_16680 [Pseudomonas psychrotolerans]